MFRDMTVSKPTTIAVLVLVVAAAIAIVCAWVLDLPRDPRREESLRVGCTTRLRTLSTVMERYVADHGAFPARLDDLKKGGYVKDVDWALRCPAATADDPPYRYLGPNVTPGSASPLIVCDKCGRRDHTERVLHADGTVTVTPLRK
jgi:hypothetical protein